MHDVIPVRGLYWNELDELLHKFCLFHIFTRANSLALSPKKTSYIFFCIEPDILNYF